MKNSFLMMVRLMVLATILYSCSSDDDSLSLSVELNGDAAFYANGGKKELVVNSNTEWKIIESYKGKAGWLITSPLTGKGNNTVIVVAEANNSTEERSVTITFVCTSDANVSQSLTIKQAGVAPSLIVSPMATSFKAIENKPAIFSVESNTAWTISTLEDVDWMTLSRKGGRGNATVEISVNDNNDEDVRKAIVVVSFGDNQTKQIEVTQLGMENFYYREPCIRWGATKATTASYMTGYQLYSENEEQLVYRPKYKEELTKYFFEDGKLYRSVVDLTSGLFDDESLSKHMLGNDYLSAGKTMSELPIFISRDNETIAIFNNKKSEKHSMYYCDYTRLFKPLTSWDTNSEMLKSQMNRKGYEIQKEVTLSDGSYSIVFNGKQLETLSQYLFVDGDSLSDIIVIFDPAIASFEKVCNYMTSGLFYHFKGENLTRTGYLYVDQDYYSVALVERPSVDNSNMVKISFFSHKYASEIWYDSRRQTRKFPKSGEYQCR